MNYKEKTKELLGQIKSLGYTRAEVESRLGIAEGAISQSLSRGGNEKMYNSVLLFKEWAILQKANNKPEEILEEPVPEYGDLMQRLIAQQNKLIDSMNRQSITANSILDRLANNVENRVQSIDFNLTDALARIEALTINVSSGRSVILKSLARIEQKPEHSLLTEADKINASWLREHAARQNKKSGKGR